VHRGIKQTELAIVGVAIALLLVASPARAQEEVRAGDSPTWLAAVDSVRPTDPDNCLTCHQFPGLSRVDKETGELRLFFTSARHWARREGPHSRLACTDCHDRTEVEKVPHDEATPISCTQECHLVTGTGSPILFTHAGLSERLAYSVHGDGAFDDLPFDPPLLREGQSECLYCHDQPVFREVENIVSSHRGDAASSRCDSCHGEELPVDADYYLLHTTSRLQPARPTRETAEICGVCHSDPIVNRDNDLHDAVASYFKSFHGKAGLLGKGDTATCVDCHATETGDVHLMLDAEDPESPISPENVRTTCRTVGCHPGAAPKMGSASVHLRIDPNKKTVEYWFTVAFVAINVGVLAQYFLLVLLELFSLVVRRQTEHHRRMIALAMEVQKHPEGALLTRRLSVHQRFQHWIFVGFFVLLVATGMPLKFAGVPEMEWLVSGFGGINLARIFHRIAGVGLLASFTYHLAYIGLIWLRVTRSKQAERGGGFIKTAIGVAWNSPMMLRPQDIKDFTHLFLHLMGLRKERPHHGRFHFTQKAEYWALYWGMATIGISGVLLWGAGWASGVFGGRALNFAIIVHTYEAFLAFASVSVLHMFAVIFSPAVFPLSPASLTGVMPAAEMAEGHEGHLLEVAGKLGIELPESAPRGPRHVLRSFIRRTYSLLLMLAVAALCYFSLSWLGQQLFGIGPAPEEVRDVATRIDLDALTSPDRRGGSRAGRYERGPLAHFHVIPAWYTPDPANGCTEGGCHDVLPHGEKKEDRAFLNMHATFVDCQVCHAEQAPRPGDLAWVSLEDRSGREPPAILQLGSLLEAPLPQAEDARVIVDREARRLLALAIDESGGDPELERWLLQLQTARVDGELYEQHVRGIRRGLSLHGHGEYAARLGIPGERFTLDAEGERAARTLRDEAASEGDREAASEVVHRGYKLSEVQCTNCHAEDAELLSFEEIGYPPRSARRLRSNSVARQSESVEKGEIFYLPDLLDRPVEELAPEAEVPAEGTEPGAEGQP
jgi:cytochrome b subunit of formate dehydrogenase